MKKIISFILCMLMILPLFPALSLGTAALSANEMDTVKFSAIRFRGLSITYLENGEEKTSTAHLFAIPMLGFTAFALIIKEKT